MKAICLWDATSEERVREVVEGMVGECSSNEYLPVDAVSTINIPASMGHA